MKHTLWLNWTWGHLVTAKTPNMFSKDAVCSCRQVDKRGQLEMLLISGEIIMASLFEETSHLKTVLTDVIDLFGWQC